MVLLSDFFQNIYLGFGKHFQRLVLYVFTPWYLSPHQSFSQSPWLDLSIILSNWKVTEKNAGFRSFDDESQVHPCFTNCSIWTVHTQTYTHACTRACARPPPPHTHIHILEPWLRDNTNSKTESFCLGGLFPSLLNLLLDSMFPQVPCIRTFDPLSQ